MTLKVYDVQIKTLYWVFFVSIPFNLFYITDKVIKTWLVYKYNITDTIFMFRFYMTSQCRFQWTFVWFLKLLLSHKRNFHSLVLYRCNINCLWVKKSIHFFFQDLSENSEDKWFGSSCSLSIIHTKITYFNVKIYKIVNFHFIL